VKGTHIRAVTDQDLKDYLQVRGVLENLAAELVEDRLVKQIDELAAAAKETVEAAYDDDANKYAIANLQFHRLIVEASNNQMLVNMWRMLVPEVQMLALTELSLGLLQQSAQEHLEIVEAFAEGDNSYAGTLLKKHAEAVLMRGFTQLYTRADLSS
jgi:DNA-binding GntR family transcriptional regulator